MSDQPMVIYSQGGGIVSVTFGMLGLPTELQEAGEQYFKLVEASKKLEARMEVLKKHIVNQMTNGLPNVIAELKQDGIKYLGFERTNVKWKDACNEIIHDLVPKTRVSDAEIIINGRTSHSVVTKVERDTSGPEM